MMRDNAGMTIPEIPPSEALQRQRAGALLLDVRESFEHATGMASGAIALPRGDIARRIAEVAPDPDADIHAIFGGGEPAPLPEGRPDDRRTTLG